MTTDAAVTLLTKFVEISLYVGMPLLAVAAVVGVVVGVIQTATQINEPAIAYAAKVAGMLAIILFVGPAIFDKMLAYTRGSFDAVAHVVE
jgi:flagellar biosynthetic protein FliQ